MLGFKDLGLNVQNHVLTLLVNREQNMSSLDLQAMLKSGCFKVQVQLIAEKVSVVLPCLTGQKLQVYFFCRIFKQAQARENV